MKKLILSLGLFVVAGASYAQQTPSQKIMQPFNKAFEGEKTGLNGIQPKGLGDPIWEDDFSDVDGQVDVLDFGSLVQGDNYVNMEGIPTAGGNGSGLTVDIMVEQNDYLLDLESLFGGSGYTTATGVDVTVDTDESDGDGMLVDIEAASFGGVSAYDEGSLEGGDNYVNAEGVTTTGGTGTGLTVDVTTVEQGPVAMLNDASLNGGEGYTDGVDVTTTTDGAGSGLTVDIEVSVAGEVITFDLEEAGDTYGDATEVGTIGGTGTGLTVDITTDGGAVQTVTINNAGSGYEVNDEVNIDAGDGAAMIRITEVSEGGIITDVTINNAGTDYSVGDVITIDGGTVDATIEVAVISGAIEMVEINTPGADYEVGDNITIDGGNGAATFTVSEVTNGEIISVVISDEGNGLYEVGDVLTITGGDGEATVTIGAMTGPITSVEVNSVGREYQVGDVITLLAGDESATINVEEIMVGKGWNTVSEGQGEWIIANQASQNQRDYMGEMESTTKENGFASFDGVSFLLQGNVNPQNAWVVNSGLIDCSDFNFVRLSFEQRYRAFNSDQTFVEVSTDGGQTWSQSVEVNQDQPTNDPAVQNTIVLNFQVNNSSEVKVRFRWFNESDSDQFGSGYGWMVDDVAFYEVPSYDLDLTSVDWGTLGNYGAHLPYYQVPLGQAAPIDFEGTVTNNGSATQNELVFKVDIEEAGFSSESNNTSIDFQETVNIAVNNSFTPTEVGAYTITGSISSEQENITPGNDSIVGAASFQVTENMYARDNGTRMGFWANRNDDGDLLAVEAGNVFDIFQEDMLWAGEAYINAASVPGSELYFILYEVTDDFEYVGETPIVELDETMIDTMVRIVFEDGITLNANSSYLLCAGSFGGVAITASNTIPAQTAYLRDGTDWFWLPSAAMVRMNFDETLSTKEMVKNDFKVSAYPNPARDAANIAFELENNADVSVVLTDMSGKVVFSTEQNNVAAGKNEISIPTNGLSNGVYFYNFDANGMNVTKKIVINK